MKQNPYDVLGIPPRSSDAEVKAAFRAAAKAHHPDRNPDDPAGAAERFRLATEAYETLKDPRQKAIYDKVSTTQSGTSTGTSTGTWTWYTTYDNRVRPTHRPVHSAEDLRRAAEAFDGIGSTSRQAKEASVGYRSRTERTQRTINDSFGSRPYRDGLRYVGATTTDHWHANKPSDTCVINECYGFDTTTFTWVKAWLKRDGRRMWRILPFEHAIGIDPMRDPRRYVGAFRDFAQAADMGTQFHNIGDLYYDETADEIREVTMLNGYGNDPDDEDDEERPGWAKMRYRDPDGTVRETWVEVQEG